MSTPEQWELGGEIIAQGTNHPSLGAVLSSWDHVIVALQGAQAASRGLKKAGVGRTEDPSLVVARVVPKLRELSEVAALVASQLEERLT